MRKPGGPAAAAPDSGCGFLGVAVGAEAVLVEEVVQRWARDAQHLGSLGYIAEALCQRDANRLALGNLANLAQVQRLSFDVIAFQTEVCGRPKCKKMRNYA